jgi:N-acetylmuramic acid 6-phosphate etherase
VTDRLDLLPAGGVVRAVVGGHREVLAALEAAEPAIAALVERAAERLGGGDGGRVVYVGAGTSGQVAALDACEWTPTFSVPDGFVVVLRAGACHPAGSREEAAAEDDAEAGAAEAEALALGPGDVVVGVSAGGATPYTLAALRVAAAAGALTGAVTCCRGTSPLARLADCPVAVPVGEEAILGSSRLKAGTAQRIVLNAFSTALMARRGRTLGHLMAGMQVADEKLRARAVRVCEQALGCDPTAAAEALEATSWEVDAALLVLAHGLTPAEARARLAATGGAIRAALDGA